MPEASSRRPRRQSADLRGPAPFVTRVLSVWQLSYVQEYFGVLIVLLAYILSKLFIEPFHRLFTLDNRDIQFPYAEVERVPVVQLFIYAGFIPLGIVFLWALISKPSFHRAHVTILGLLISLIFTSFITDVLKNSIGRPRPDLISRCKPALGTPEHKLISFKACTQDDHHILHDGWRSFPSGHSSFAFGGLWYLALFLAGQFHVYQPGLDLTRLVIVFLPVFGAFLIALSRLEDYRHDLYDVSAGSLLGILVAYVTYRKYYPPLTSARSALAYSLRGDTKRKKKFSKLRNDEEQTIGQSDLDDEHVDEDTDSEASTHERI